MMQVRCQRCGWVFTMSRDAIGLAVAEAEAAHAEHFQEHCPKCRNVIKIQVKELRRRLPPDYVLPTPPPKPAPVHVDKKDETTQAATASLPKPAPKSAPEPAPKPAPKAKSAPKAKAQPKTKAKTAAKRSTKPKK